MRLAPHASRSEDIGFPGAPGSADPIVSTMPMSIWYKYTAEHLALFVKCYRRTICNSKTSPSCALQWQGMYFQQGGRKVWLCTWRSKEEKEALCLLPAVNMKQPIELRSTSHQQTWKFFQLRTWVLLMTVIVRSPVSDMSSVWQQDSNNTLTWQAQHLYFLWFLGTIDEDCIPCTSLLRSKLKLPLWAPWFSTNNAACPLLPQCTAF